jgi:hypothetical protein
MIKIIGSAFPNEPPICISFSYKTNYMVIVVQFVLLGSLLSNKPPRLQSMQLLVDRAAWFYGIYLNSTCTGGNTRRCGKANKEAQGSKE